MHYTFPKTCPKCPCINFTINVVLEVTCLTRRKDVWVRSPSRFPNIISPVSVLHSGVFSIASSIHNPCMSSQIFGQFKGAAPVNNAGAIRCRNTCVYVVLASGRQRSVRYHSNRYKAKVHNHQPQGGNGLELLNPSR